jgi:hypothetical protein
LLKKVLVEFGLAHFVVNRALLTFQPDNFTFVEFHNSFRLDVDLLELCEETFLTLESPRLILV